MPNDSAKPVLDEDGLLVCLNRRLIDTGDSDVLDLVTTTNRLEARSAEVAELRAKVEAQNRVLALIRSMATGAFPDLNSGDSLWKIGDPQAVENGQYQKWPWITGRPLDDFSDRGAKKPRRRSKSS
jgi:hypothetical protein